MSAEPALRGASLHADDVTAGYGGDPVIRTSDAGGWLGRLAPHTAEDVGVLAEGFERLHDGCELEAGAYFFGHPIAGGHAVRHEDSGEASRGYRGRLRQRLAELQGRKLGIKR